MNENNRFPVMLTFDVDAQTLWTARDPEMINRPIAPFPGQVRAQGGPGPGFAAAGRLRA